MVEYKNGSVLTHKVDIVAHQVNCQGKMNSGLAANLRRRYKNLLSEYRAYCVQYNKSESLLGTALIIEGEKYSSPGKKGSKKLIANLFGQFTESREGERTTDYTSLKNAMIHLRILCENTAFSTRDGVWTVGMPYKIGCGYGGGDWSIVEKIIHDVFDESAVINLIIFKMED